MEKKKLTWRELKALNPAAFEQYVESLLDYVEEAESLETFTTPNGELFQDGCYPGDEYGGSLLLAWTGDSWEESEDYGDEDDSEQDEDEQD
jgi:hypothetical protein